MTIQIIETRLAEYQPQTKIDEWNALKEITQEIALSALSRAGLFENAAFQGGTCLRIVYGLNRFSEDLDFLLKVPDQNFIWAKYLNELQIDFTSYGSSLEIIDRSEASATAKKAFLKEDSFGKILQLEYPRTRSDKRKIQIKLEIDTNPPEGSQFETKFIDFPFPFSVLAQDRSSLFAGKCHALLCRPYTKGRDWFDFIWYVSRRTSVNYVFLSSALFQQGPWSNTNLQVNSKWLCDALSEKISQIDWNMAIKDIERFLKPADARNVRSWNTDMIQAYLQKLRDYLAE